MRTAIGLIAGPDSPAVTLEILGRRLSVSIAIARKVLTREIASAPASSAIRAICATLVTLGESLTISGRWEYRRAIATTSSRARGSQPNWMPPWDVLGQDTFSS